MKAKQVLRCPAHVSSPQTQTLRKSQVTTIAAEQAKVSTPLCSWRRASDVCAWGLGGHLLKPSRQGSSFKTTTQSYCCSLLIHARICESSTSRGNAPLSSTAS